MMNEWVASFGNYIQSKFLIVQLNAIVHMSLTMPDLTSPTPPVSCILAGLSYSSGSRSELRNKSGAIFGAEKHHDTSAE
jgi:hypothetical protein